MENPNVIRKLHRSTNTPSDCYLINNSVSRHPEFGTAQRFLVKSKAHSVIDYPERILVDSLSYDLSEPIFASSTPKIPQRIKSNDGSVIHDTGNLNYEIVVTSPISREVSDLSMASEAPHRRSVVRRMHIRISREADTLSSLSFNEDFDGDYDMNTEGSAKLFRVQYARRASSARNIHRMVRRGVRVKATNLILPPPVPPIVCSGLKQAFRLSDDDWTPKPPTRQKSIGI